VARAAEWSQLLRHASQLLAEQEPAVKVAFAKVHRAEVDRVDEDYPRRTNSYAAMEAYAAYIAATRHAQQVMDRLAGFLVDDSTTDNGSDHAQHP
jgi:hypothetical protein